jgi:hypothetical protein
MTIGACFVFRREISRSLFWDFFDSIGHERRFRPVRQMSAYLLTAAEKQTSANRCLGPITDFDHGSRLSQRGS